jgi:mono/diheme cytochrome c family protein
VTARGDAARLLSIGLALAAVLLATLAGDAAAGEVEDRALYDRWCARCHGSHGDGRGLAAAALALNGRAPRDFVAGQFKFTSVRPGEGATDADLARTIALGVPGTSMPAFADLLGTGEIARLVAVVRRFAATPRPPGTPLDLGAEPADDAASRARGERIYARLGCVDCHGASGRGDGPAAATLRAADGSPSAATDLTRPWSFGGGSSAHDVALRVATGIAGTPMPAYVDVASAAELWDLAHHVGALARAPSLEAAAVAAAGVPPGDGTLLRERGEYLVKSGTCFLCHVQMNPDGSYAEGTFGAGGMRVGIHLTATVFSRNLTPDADTGLAAWSADDLRRALRDGRAPDGRILNPLDMPWTVLALLTDRDVDAIHAYLASLPAVRNLVPPPEAPPLLAGVVLKSKAIVEGEAIGGGYHPGNAGRRPRAGESPRPVTNPRAPLVLAAACAAALAALVAATRRARRRRGVEAILLLLLLWIPLVYAWPPLTYLPPRLVKAEAPFDRIARFLALPPIPPPPPPRLGADPATRALAERGRYVAALGTCTLCHSAGPSLTRPWRPYPAMGGGMRVSWRVFGTTYSRNLTPDRDTGLGTWTRAEIRRAIVSGIARDGRQMHWQAMPWDHFSNLSPEDLEALVVYLQQLPPVYSRIPDPEPPRAGDPDADTFYFGYVGEMR